MDNRNGQAAAPERFQFEDVDDFEDLHDLAELEAELEAGTAELANFDIDTAMSDVPLALVEDTSAPKPAPAHAAPTPRRKPKGATRRTTPVSIRMPNDLLAALRSTADRLEVPYQRLLLQILRKNVQ